MRASIFSLLALLSGLLTATGPVLAQEPLRPKVYMTRDLSPAGLQKAYQALGRPAPEGKKVGIKISFGEPGGRHYLAPDLIRELVQATGGVFIDGNTTYGGRRGTVKDHLETAEAHGFSPIAPVDILDEDGEIRLPVTGGVHLKEVRVGSHFSNYDFVLVLTHFKGHAMAGFGGALKNIAIGIASPAGKALIHTAGQSATNMMDGPKKQEDFLEAMAEAAEGMIKSIGAGNMIYLNVMNNLSVDCDCSASPSPPAISDIGILASLDPVALDKACLDLIYQADARAGASLRERIESRKGAHILAHAEKLGLGRQDYELINIDH